jgi:hypothetical protein
VILAALVACLREPPPATEFGNPERRMGVAADPGTAEETPTAPHPFTSAWIGLGETKLVLEETEADRHELEWETPELVTDLVRDATISFRSPNAGYDRIELRPRDGRDGPPAAPEALEDASFVLDGVRASDGVPFHLESATEEDLVLRGGFVLAGEERRLALGFDLVRWAEALELDTLEADGGTVRIGGGANTAALRRFEAVLADSVTLAVDADGDGRIGEADPILLGP